MFDIGFWELAMVGLIALIILGPERLPRAARTAGLWVGRARKMLAEVKADIDKEIRQTELEEVQNIGADLKKAEQDLKESTKVFDETIDFRGSSSDSGSKPKSESASNNPDTQATPKST